jgi:hypothetical protein
VSLSRCHEPGAAVDPATSTPEFGNCRPAALFQSAFWLDLVAPGQWQAIEVRHGSELKARMPIVLTKGRLGLLEVAMPPLTPFLGPSLFSAAEKYERGLARQHQLLEELIDKLPKVAQFHQRFSPDVTNWLPFAWKGFQQTTRYTYRLEPGDLIDTDVVWNCLEKELRTDIRKAARTINVTFDNDIETFVALHAAVFERQDVATPHSLALVRRVSQAASRHGCHSIVVARDSQGRPHAAAFLVWDSATVYYLLGGSDPTLRGSGAVSLVLWESLKFAARRNLAFDFEGSMVRRLERLFRAFGARQTPYFDLRCTTSTWLRIRHDVARWFSRA